MHTIKSKQKRDRLADADLLRIAMIQLGLTYRDLAALVGKPPQRVANVLSGNDRSWPIRAAINRAMRQRILHKLSGAVPHAKTKETK